MIVSKNTLIIFIALITLTACGINDRVSYSDREGRLSEKLIHNISRPGTQKSVILGNLGMPESVDTFSSDVATSENRENQFEVYNYRMSEKQIRTGHLLYVFNTSAMETSVKYFHVVMRKDAVEKAWFDDKPTGSVMVRSHPMANAPKKMSDQAMLDSEKQPKTIVYVVPEEAPKEAAKDDALASSVAIQTQAGTQKIETKKSTKFEWKVPILKKWFGPKEDKKGVSQSQQTSYSDGKKIEMAENQMQESRGDNTSMNEMTMDTAAMEKESVKRDGGEENDAVSKDLEEEDDLTLY